MHNAVVRRSITIPALLFMTLVAIVTAPVLYVVAIVCDLASRRRLALTATLAWIHVYVVAELLGLAALGWLSLRRARFDPDEWIERHYRISRLWTRAQFVAARRLYGFRVEVAGDEVLREGPYIFLCRHVSILDNLLPSVFAESVHGIRLRWVFDSRLLRQPSIDIIGHRLPNVFVGKDGGTPVRDLRRVAKLAQGLGPRDGIAIFPEGTLYAPSKRKLKLERLSRRRTPEVLDAASGLQHVLPPEFGAVLILLKASPDLDVVFCAHTGLEGGLNRASIARGGLNGSTLRVQFWRVPASEIPRVPAEQRAWLVREWGKVDAAVSGALASANGRSNGAVPSRSEGPG